MSAFLNLSSVWMSWKWALRPAQFNETIFNVFSVSLLHGSGFSLMEAPSMFQVARLVGDTLREVIQRNSDVGQKADATFHATFIVGGQINGSETRLFLIYPEGNFIEANSDTPYFQIGETKYGRPILLRAYDAEMSWEEAIKLLLISFDSTVKANLSVGLPLDMQIYQNDSFFYFLCLFFCRQSIFEKKIMINFRIIVDVLIIM